MKLKIDSSSLDVTGVSLEDKGVVISQKEMLRSPRSQVLVKSIMDLIKEVPVAFDQLDEIEVAKGPGSFTSLRVGAAVANALAYGLGIKVNQKQIETELVYK